MSIFRRFPALFWGLGLTLVVLALGFFRVPSVDRFLQGLEFMLYDVRMGLMAEPEAESSIVLVDIDERSIQTLGRWPWPRSYLAQGLANIYAGGPRAVGLSIILTEPQEDPGLVKMRVLEKLFNDLSLDQASNGPLFHRSMNDVMASLEYDNLLAEVIDAMDNVVMLSTFLDAEVARPQPEEVELALTRFAVTLSSLDPDADVPQATALELPIPPFFNAMAGMGHNRLLLDSDGKARRNQLVFGYRGNYYPSYTLALAAEALDVDQADIQLDAGYQIRLGGHVIPISRQGDYLATFKGGHEAFEHVSFLDLLLQIQSTEDEEAILRAQRWFKDKFENKIVILGFSATGLASLVSTPAGTSMTIDEYTANTVWSLLNEKSLLQPAWNKWSELGLILFIGLMVTFVLPRLKALPASTLFIILLLGLITGAGYFFLYRGLWITTSYPMVLLVFGYLGSVSLKYFVTEVRKEKVEGESAETNRMLGLSFQSQGMLDMAFDKFRKVPVDKSMKDVLYTLAQDYERKRQFNKAVTVYEYIESHDPKFKDVVERKKKMIQVGETMILGGGSGGVNLLANLEDGARPTLGRYEIVKQLGRGAMGIVFLGRDPRINRTTAIKTFQFAEDVDEAEAEKLKQRFFQEAESAGTLAHPNIVTIYDAGEEQDLAYIAMEYLEGSDLKDYSRKDKLLPMLDVVKYMADVAEGLDYAHQKGIVHRDIKPANIMLLTNGVVKITDFGIARITASSQTQTGVVKGTPHYMSPEQISGQKVDGRSDLFSLGVVLYQMLTGEVPFRGENVSTLMHQIMNEPHPDPRRFNPQIVKYLVIIITKALQKDREKRYQRAAQMAEDLRKVAQWMESRMAREKNGNGGEPAEEAGDNPEQA